MWESRSSNELDIHRTSNVNVQVPILVTNPLPVSFKTFTTLILEYAVKVFTPSQIQSMCIKCVMFFNESLQFCLGWMFFRLHISLSSFTLALDTFLLGYTVDGNCRGEIKYSLPPTQCLSWDIPLEARWKAFSFFDVCFLCSSSYLAMLLVSCHTSGSSCNLQNIWWWLQTMHECTYTHKITSSFSSLNVHDVLKIHWQIQCYSTATCVWLRMITWT